MPSPSPMVQVRRNRPADLTEQRNQKCVPSPPFSFFDAFVGGVGAANAYQTSTIGATDLSGSGGTSADGGGGGGTASSVFDLTFRIDEPAVYSLAGAIGISDASGAQGFVALLSPSGALYELPTLIPNQNTEFANTGTLDPGVDYRLVIASSHPEFECCIGAQGSGWTFEFGIIAVP